MALEHCILAHNHCFSCREASERVRNLKREVEALYQTKIPGSRTRKFDTEVFEMKPQLWLRSCSQENQRTSSGDSGTYGRAFVAPVLPGSRRTADDMRNLIDDI